MWQVLYLASVRERRMYVCLVLVLVLMLMVYRESVDVADCGGRVLFKDSQGWSRTPFETNQTASELLLLKKMFKLT